MLNRFCFAVKNRPNVYGHFFRGKTNYPRQYFDYATKIECKSAYKPAMRAFLVQHQCVEVQSYYGWLMKSKKEVPVQTLKGCGEITNLVIGEKINLRNAGYDKCARNMAIYLAASDTKENIFMSFENKMVVLLSKPINLSDAEGNASEKQTEDVAKAYEGGLFNPQGSLGDTANKLLKSLIGECGVKIENTGSKFITYGNVIGPDSYLFNYGLGWPNQKKVFWKKGMIKYLESSRKSLHEAMDAVLPLKGFTLHNDKTQYEIVGEPSQANAAELEDYVYNYTPDRVLYMNFAPVFESTVAAEVKMTNGGRIRKACHVKSWIIGENCVGRIIRLSWNALGMSVGTSNNERQAAEVFSKLKEEDKPCELYVVEVHVFQLEESRKELR